MCNKLRHKIPTASKYEVTNIYLKLIKTQLSIYNLTLDVPLSNKNMNLWSRFQGNIFLVLYLLIKGHNLDTTKAKSSNQLEYQNFFMPGSFGFNFSEMFTIDRRSVRTLTELSCFEALTIKV